MLAHRLRRFPNIKPTIGQTCAVCANTIYSPKVGSMLAHRLRRCSNIEPTLGECLVCAGAQSVMSCLANLVTCKKYFTADSIL